MLNNKDNKYEYAILMAAGCLLGILCFVCVYGIKILDFTYDAWLFNWDIDLKQHYVGWCHFRNNRWQFPVGMIDTLSVPYSMSVVYTDSIPLFAIIFKLFRDILPAHFQYFGLYGLISFGLMGALSTILVRRFTRNKLLCVASSLFFIMSFTVLHRMYYHTALASQWIIILALIIWLYREEDESVVSASKKWGTMAFLCVVIHSYFVAMTGMILLADTVEKTILEIRRLRKSLSKVNADSSEKKRNYLLIFAITLKNLIPLEIFCVVTIVTLYILGGFSGAGSVSAGGIGVFGANMNTYINPDSMGRILKTMPYATTFQYEGFGYLGAGILLVYICILIRFFTGFVKEKTDSENNLNNNWKCYIKRFIVALTLRRKIVILLCVVSFLAAVFPLFSLNEKVLFSIPLPKALNSLFGIFRSNGRFIWVSMYVLMLIAIVYAARHINERFIKALFIIALIIQLFDISSFVKTRQEYFNVKQEFDNPFEEYEKYNIYDNKKSFVMLYNEISYMMEAGMYGYLHNMDLNCFYYARTINEEMDATINAFKDEIRKGIIRDDTVYIMKGEDYFSEEFSYIVDEDLKIYYLGDYVIFAK